ncbi:MAG: hypothetical protein HN737_04540 [Desulfobacterales bacterium]|jgi:methionine synthase II (cobalamin-independent)|nr:hypothetical protein [Desulfobacteraceae bacterium]MBT7696661.1 hypothetical protein [Desulfobacterales bacterium]
MKTEFQANLLPTLIGSLPIDNHRKAVEIVAEHTPEIPLWVQLPAYKEEGMMVQFMPGLPGFTFENDKAFIDTKYENFEGDLLKFYEDFVAVEEGGIDLSDPSVSRFALTNDMAPGFFEFLDYLDTLAVPPVAVKGQITGPVTIGTGLNDQDGRPIFYNEQLRDAAVKHLAMKARWQVRQLSKYGCPVIIFFDEPALTGFGSSSFISISREEIENCFNEVINAVHAEGGLAGIHVCANAEWSLVLESPADIVSFDAYAFFDKFILYPEQLKRFIKAGGILAWGLVPTLNAEDLEKETTDSLIEKFDERVGKIEALGIDMSTILAQSLITPSCGTGSLSLENAVRVLKLTGDLSKRLRSRL